MNGGTGGEVSGIERRRFLALLLSPALLAAVSPLRALAEDDGKSPQLAGSSPWLDACAPLGKVRAQTLAALAADLLPPAALKLDDATLAQLAAAEAARIGGTLSADPRFAPWHIQQLDALTEKTKAMWQDLPAEKRNAWLTQLFAAPDPAATADDSAAHTALQNYLLRLRSDLEVAFWELPPLALRVIELSDVKR